MTQKRPVYRGLAIYRHLRHKYSLLYPEGWARSELPASAGGGVVLLPDTEDSETSLAVQSRRLRVKVRPDDLDAIREGFLEGIRALPESAITREEARAVGKLVTLEAEHTYRDAASGAVRRRWTRLLYQNAIQVSLIAQGSSVERFKYWLPMFNTAMRTVQFADWWAEATGTSWQTSIGSSAADRPGTGGRAATPPRGAEAR